MLALAAASLRYLEAFPALVVAALFATLFAKAASAPPAVPVLADVAYLQAVQPLANAPVAAGAAGLALTHMTEYCREELLIKAWQHLC